MKKHADFLESREVEYTWSYTVNADNTATITEVSPKLSGNITIPNRLDKHNVTIIGDSAIRNHPNLESIEIPTGIKTINSNAFRDDIALTAVVIPSTVTDIQGSVFYNCKNLKTLEIPEGVKNIGSYAFANCINLKSVSIPSTLTKINEGSFTNCDQILSVNITDLNAWCGIVIDGDTHPQFALPLHLGNKAKLYLNGQEITGEIVLRPRNPSLYDQNNQRITRNAFLRCDKITNVVIDNNTRYIQQNAFRECTSLTSITIPDTIEYILQDAFLSCDQLNYVQNPYSTSTSKYLPIAGTDNYWFIKHDANSDISDFVLLSNTTKIAAEAFANCEKIKTITIPENLKRVNSYAFASTSIDNVYIYNLSTWCETMRDDYANPAAYSNCLLSLDIANPGRDNCIPIYLSNHFEIPAGVKSLGTNSFSRLQKISSVYIPDTVTLIYGKSFYDCENLVSVYIPDTVTGIGTQAFCYCYKLAFVRDDNTLPPNITTIANYLFSYDRSLSNITIPKNVYTISQNAFEYCTQLTSVVLPEDSVLSNINQNAFLNCTALPEITFPSGVLSIGKNSFANCNKLSSVSFNDNLETIYDNAFQHCISLSTANLPDSLTYVGLSAFINCYELSSVHLNDNITTLGQGAFQNCYELEKINDANTLPSGITTVEKSVFENCNELKQITIPNNIKTIKESAFDNCDNLSDVYIGNGVTSVQDNAFRECTKLKNVHANDLKAWCEIEFDDWDANPIAYSKKLFINNTLLNNDLDIPFGTKKIGNYVFYRYPLESVTLPATVKTVGNYSFAECDSLKTVTTNDKITDIGKYAFRNCTDLSILYVNDVIKNVHEGAFYNCNKLTLFKNENDEPTTYITENDIYFYPEGDGYTLVKNPIDLDKFFNKYTGQFKDYTLDNAGQYAIGSDGKKTFMCFPVKYNYPEHPIHFTYSGINTNIDPETDTDVPEISSAEYGACDYENITQTAAVDGDVIYSSADKFTHAIAVIEQAIPLDGTSEQEAENPVCKIYNLNSDASYIALYPGISGFIRTWAVDLYKDSREPKSVELLGYEHHDISAAADDFIKHLVIDDGTYTNVDANAVADTVYRVHEDYEALSMIQIHTNTEDLYDHNDPDSSGLYNSELSFTVKLSAENSFNVTTQNIDKYNALIYNKARGSVFPIYIGALKGLSNENALNYISTQTPADEYFLKNKTLLAETQLTGTPNVFKYKIGDQYVAATETNSFFNISSIEIEFSQRSGDGTLSLDFTMHKLDRSGNFVFDKNSFFIAIFDNSMAEYENYHYMLHHPTSWPYNSPNDTPAGLPGGGWPPAHVPEDSDSAGVPMSALSSLNVIPQISSGALAFKTNEESEIDYESPEKYPPALSAIELYKAFATVNTRSTELCNLFMLSNTFIFEIEQPKELTELLSGEIQIPMYASTRRQDYVTNESLSAARIYNGTLSGLGGGENTVIHRRNSQDEVINIDVISAFSLSAAELPPHEEAHSIYSISEKDLQDFLKIYVNYARNENGEITLFFNYNNLFNSPYVYRRKSGIFCTCYKPETYLMLRPGESGLLTIITQPRFVDGYGDIRGVKDLPVLAYKIWNVSDDKPKFVIKNKWVIDDITFETIRGKEIGENFGYFKLKIDSVTNNTGVALTEDYTTPSVQSTNHIVTFMNEDGTAPNIGEMIESITYDLIYEPYDSDVEIKDAVTTIKDGRTRVSTTKHKHSLTMKLKLGTVINEITLEKTVWMDIINPVVTLKNGATISGTDADGKDYIEIIPGYAKFKFNVPGSGGYKLLSKEENAGYIFNETEHAMRVYGETTRERQEEAH